MKEKLQNIKNKTVFFWTKRSKSQKGIFLGSVAVIAALILALVVFVNNSGFVSLYNNLSLQEVSQIKTELDARNVPYKLEDQGTTVLVPEDNVDALLVDLAGQGLPNNGNIDYSFFSENASWGITDNEFNMIKLDAMQTELADLIANVKGINSAKVMINMPKDPVFISEKKQDASASIVISTQPGYEFKENQIEGLYHLVSKAVPNLPEDNIVIMDQYFDYFDRDTPNGNGVQDTYTYQQDVKQDIEMDIRRRLQQMLGAMVGMENVIVSVTADIDFTKENRVEELVEPVDVENMEGVPVSIESVQETYSGTPPIGGTAGSGEGDIAGYEAQENDGSGDYELSKETINNEYNRIRKEIVESPYKIRDLGIQVAVNKVKQKEGEDSKYLTAQEQDTVTAGISSILKSMVSTSIDGAYGEVQPEEKVSIVFQEFSEQLDSPAPKVPVIPKWMYIAGGALLLIIIVLSLILWRNRNTKEDEDEAEETLVSQIETEIPETASEEESEAAIRKKQLEKMASENPEDFAKLLRSWIADD